MRLAYLSGTAIPSRAASALHVVKMCNALAQSCEVTVYALKGEQDDLSTYYESPIDFVFQGFNHSALPGAGYRFAARTAFKEMHSPKDAFYGRHLNSLWFTSKFAKPFAYEAHGMPRTDHERWLLARVTQQTNCRGVVCITQLLANEMQELVPPSTQLRVLSDAADIPDSGRGKIAASPWPGRPGVPQIGYVGHLYPGKGMEMVYALAESSPQWDFHIVGGRDEDIQTWRGRGALNNLFFHGYVKHGELPGYYQRLDVALLPLQPKVWIADRKNEIGRWTSPLKAFEYMAHQLPIVASDTPALAEIFDNEKTALMVGAQVLPDWQAAIQRIVSNPTLANSLVEQAYDVFLSKHTWTQRAAAVVDLLS